MQGGPESHVLVVDGERAAQGCVRSLARRGFRLSYTDARFAVAEAERLQPQAIIVRVDPLQPEHIDVCRALATGRATRRIPIIALAGSPAQENGEFMIHLRVAICDADTLAATIRRISEP